LKNWSTSQVAAIVTVTRYGKPVATIISMKQGAEIYPELRREPAAAVEG